MSEKTLRGCWEDDVLYDRFKEKNPEGAGYSLWLTNRFHSNWHYRCSRELHG
jgi:hypothetical protein